MSWISGVEISLFQGFDEFLGKALGGAGLRAVNHGDGNGGAAGGGRLISLGERFGKEIIEPGTLLRVERGVIGELNRKYHCFCE